jgi:2-haloacid dehalogenase
LSASGVLKREVAMTQTGGGRGPAIVFDLGGVLIDWNPRHLYRKLIEDEAAMEWFLAEVCHSAWNEEQDRGRAFAAAIEEAATRHPEHRPLIEAYFARWEEMMAGPIDGSVMILKELKDSGHELHALTNWSAETFPFARDRFAFLDCFESILVSADVGLIKPDPRIFELLLERIGRRPAECVYIDDNPKNAAAAAALGLDAIAFESAGQLRAELTRRGLLPGRAESP